MTKTIKPHLLRRQLGSMVLCLLSAACIEPPSGSASEQDMSAPDMSPAPMIRADMSVPDMSPLDQDMSPPDMAQVVARIVVEPAMLTLERTQVLADPFQLKFFNANQEELPGEAELTVAITNPDVVAYDQETHTLTASKAGETTLTIASGELTASLQVTVLEQRIGALHMDALQRIFLFEDQKSSLPGGIPGGSGVTQVVSAVSTGGLPMDIPPDQCTLEWSTHLAAEGATVAGAGVIPARPAVIRRSVFCQQQPSLKAEAVVVIEYPQKVAGKGSHSCMITSAGALSCWGFNASGQVGAGAPVDALAPTTPDFPEPDLKFQDVSASQGHTCAIDFKRGLWCWGENASGQIDPADEAARFLVPRRVMPEQRFVAVAVADERSCAIDQAGALWCWGTGRQGQLGLGSLVKTPTPMRVVEGASESLGSVSHIALSNNHTCALTLQGKPKCWGFNGLGQLGTSNISSASRPADVVLPNGPPALDYIDTGDGTTCGAKGRTLVCWGQLEQPDAPYNVKAIDDPALLEVSLENITDKLSVGLRHRCLLGGTQVYCWGRGERGQLGLGERGGDAIGNNNVFMAQPTLLDEYILDGEALRAEDLDLRALAAARTHTCALDSLDRLFCWGSAAHGRSANGQDAIKPFDGATPSFPLSQVDDVTVGQEHVCAIASELAAPLTLKAYCWGANLSIQQHGLSSSSAFRGLDETPQQVYSSGTTLKSAQAGEDFTCALNTSNYLMCWGANAHNQCAKPYKNLSIPPAVNTANVAGTFPGIFATGYRHACGVVGTDPLNDPLRCWGAANFGQLGIKGYSERTASAPVVADVLWEDQLRRQARLVTAGFDFTCAVVNDLSDELSEELVCWGREVKLWGGLEGRATPDTPFMERVSREARPIKTYPKGAVSQLAAGGFHGCAVLTSGELECWGRNDMHQISPLDTPLFPEPVAVDMAEKFVAQVATGHQHTCVIASDAVPMSPPQGDVYCWGEDHMGQSSGRAGSVVAGERVQEAPYKVNADVTGWQAHRVATSRGLSSDQGTTCAIASTGALTNQLFCWGSNTHEQAQQWQGAQEPMVKPGLTPTPTLALP